VQIAELQSSLTRAQTHLHYYKFAFYGSLVVGIGLSAWAIRNYSKKQKIEKELYLLQDILHENSDNSGDTIETHKLLAVKTTCVICWENSRSEVLLPCKHMCLCQMCLANLEKSRYPSCPMCYSNIERALHVYIS